MGGTADRIETGDEGRGFEARLRRLLDSAAGAMAIVDSAGQVGLVNAQMEELFGYAGGDLTGRAVEELIPDRLRAGHPAHRADFTAAPRTRAMGEADDLVGLRQDRSEFPIQISLSPIQTREGLLVSVAVRDVSTRRSIETRFRDFVESAPDAIVMADPDGVIVLVNVLAEDMFGYPREELLGVALEVLLPEESRAVHPHHRSEYFASAKVRSMGVGPQLYGRRKDGTRFPIEVSLSPLETDDGVLASAAIRDVTERRAADAMRTRLASIVESAHDAIMSSDLNGVIDSWNPAAEKLLGYTAAEAIGQSALVLFPPDLISKALALQAGLRGGSDEAPYDSVRRAKTGQDIEVLVSPCALRDREGTLTGFSAVMRDLTLQRQGETARFHLASIIESSTTAITSTGMDGRFTSWNASTERLYGYTAAEAVGQLGEFLAPPGQEQETKDRWARLQGGGVMETYDTVRRRKDGSFLDVAVTASVIRDAGHSVVGVSAFTQDIGQRKRMERSLATAREDAVSAGLEFEAFTYAMAHDLRAPLRAIDGFTHLGQEQYEAGAQETARNSLGRARAAAQHMGGLLDALLLFAQVTRQPINSTTVNLSDLVTSVVAGLRAESPHRTIETVIEPGLTHTGDQDLLGIAIRHLIENAWKFTEHQSHPRVEFGRNAEGYFITDNGDGFDMAHANKLFVLFQRLHTPESARGTGIGLVTTQRIIRRHGGRIWAEGTPGHGATFTFTLQPPETKLPVATS